MVPLEVSIRLNNLQFIGGACLNFTESSLLFKTQRFLSLFLYRRNNMPSPTPDYYRPTHTKTRAQTRTRNNKINRRETHRPISISFFGAMGLGGLPANQQIGGHSLPK